ncbi:MAG: DUF4126 domain-containing protein [Gemmatimonadales bacterium]
MPAPLAILALLVGVVAGLRSMTAPAFVAWGARLGRLRLDGTALAWLGSGVAAWICLALALGELVADKLPRTPSRTRPGPFIVRLVTGALSGAGLAVGAGGSLAAGAVLGALGAVVGTLGGYHARAGLVPALGVPDSVVALVEDLIAVGGAVLLVQAARTAGSAG